MRCGCNLALYQGDDWAALVCIANADGTTADLTGYTAQAQLRAGVADQNRLVEARMLCAVVPTDPAADPYVPPYAISLSLTSAQTTLLTEPRYRWDLQIVSPGGITTTILAGEVRVTFEVTRETTPVPVVWREPGYLVRYRVPMLEEEVLR